jgi:hypothetical protein
VHLKAEAETRPHWHDRVKAAVPAIPRSNRSNAEPPVLSPQAERRPPLAHAGIGPLGIAPRVDDLLLTQAQVAVAVIRSGSSRAEAEGRATEDTTA